MAITTPSEKQSANGAQSPRSKSDMGSFPTEQFPTAQNQASPVTSTSQHDIQEETRNRDEPTLSRLTGRLSSASKKLEESSPPLGIWDATATTAAKAPSITDIRQGKFGSDAWSKEGQLKDRKRRSSASGSNSQIEEVVLQSSVIHAPRSHPETHISASIPQRDSALKVIEERQPQQSIMNFSPGSPPTEDDKLKNHQNPTKSSTDTGSLPVEPTETGKATYMTTPFDNGYQFPPQHTWTEATVIGTKAFWKYATTPLGFLVTIYGLNVVAWGGMIFLLLCNAAPAMCRPTCNDINSPRRIWIEIDSQVLTALFCVTGFGLIPWRFRDLYYLLRWRLMKDPMGLRRLAGIHRDWFRLEGSENLPSTLGPADIESEHANYPEMSLPYPLASIPDAPLTGIRAPPTATWRLDYVIWNFVWNTFLQAVLSGLMWGLNRYNRPSWSTGVFVALACIVAALAGIEIFIQGRKVKAVEGISISDKDLERLRRDKEMGRANINTMSGKAPKEKKLEEKGRRSAKKMNKSRKEGSTE